MVVDGFYYIDAEDFDHCGRWQMDNQFVDLMGSPYPMATEIGKPVEDAAVSIHLARGGEYHVWVRDQNWEYGGKVQVEKGKLDFALHDLTVYHGRCDAMNAYPLPARISVICIGI